MTCSLNFEITEPLTLLYTFLFRIETFYIVSVSLEDDGTEKWLPIANFCAYELNLEGWKIHAGR